MTRTPTRKLRLTRRDLLRWVPVGGAAAAAAGLGAAHFLRPVEAQAAGECRICTMHCGFIATTLGDTVVKVEGDQNSNTRGFLCEHGKAIPELIHTDQRLKRPLKREGDAFVEIGWDQALREIGERLLAVKEKFGPEALVVQTGWPFVRHPMIHLLHRFCRAFGTPNLATVASLCEASGRMGRSLVYGTNYSVDMRKVRTLLVWGSNPPRTAPPWAYLLTNVKKRGKLVVIDVVKTEIAEKANLFVRVRPGTDSAFALGMIRHILANNLHAQEFVATQVLGLEELRALAEEWTPERVAEVTGCAKDQVVEVAELFAKRGPSGIWDGLGIEHHRAGVDTVRLVSSLVALCNYGGAQTFHDKPAAGATGEVLPLVLGIEQQQPVPPPPQKMPIGYEEYPVFCAVHRQAQASLLPRAVLEDRPYPIRAMIHFGCNPAVTTPDSGRLRAAYDKLELLVSVDPFLSESGELADYVLPAATFVEQPMLRWGKEQHPAIVEPQGQARPDAEILFGLASQVGLREYFPWQNLIEAFEAPRTVVLDDWLKEKMAPLPEARGGNFPTASGKVELASVVLPRFGLPAVPKVELPDEKTAEYPLQLVTGPRQRAYVNSQFHQLPSMARLLPEAEALIHPERGRSLGLIEGAKVVVVTETGRSVYRAKLTEAVDPEVVVVPNGWPGEANANRLTSTEGLDPISGFPRLRGLVCRLEPGGR
jgi:anaerobic selenocysteine-containing dehydrogenase